jgi:hypothetical protein
MSGSTLLRLGRPGALMNSFYEHHKGSIRWHYRCFDRILLNGLIQPFQQPERVVGFFNTYRQLYPVGRNTLRSISDQFQAWLKAWAGKRNIPVTEAPKGRRDGAGCQHRLFFSQIEFCDNLSSVAARHWTTSGSDCLTLIEQSDSPTRSQ